MQIAILLGIVCVIAPLVLYSLRLSYVVRSDDEFFLGRHTLSARDLFDTLAAGWLMLGNVFLACMILGKYYGAHNWWLILTWLCAFLFMMNHVESAAHAIKSHRTLHSFLKSKFASRSIRVLAAIITASTGIGIIALEIIVVMALLVPVTGHASPWFPFLAGFAILLSLALYAVFGGFSAVTDTDRFQLIGVILALLSLLFLIVRAIANQVVSIDQVLAALRPTFASSGTSAYWFFAGIFFLQVPLLLGDFGTWQRIKASSPTEISAQRKTFGKLGLLNAAAWLVLVATGIVLAAVPSGKLPQYPDSFLYATAAPIVDLLSLSMIPSQFGQPYVGIALTFFLVAGLVCAMMSTADTYLLISLQTLYEDLLPQRPSETKGTQAGIRIARIFAVFAILTSFLIALYVVLNKANFIPIISLLFSLQVALSPFALFALYYAEPASLRLTGIASLCATICACAGYGLWAIFSPAAAGTYHQINVTFILPVGAFVIPAGALLLHVLIRSGPRATWILLKTCLVGDRRKHLGAV